MNGIARFSLPLLLAASLYSQQTAVKTKPPADYLLDSDDAISIRAVDADEISTPGVRIDTRGDVTLPRLGRIHAAGLTTEQLADAIAQKLSTYLKHPDVVVTLLEMRGEPVSVLGSVQTPGVQKLQGRKTLYEVISAAGGIRSDAGYEIKITRRLEQGRIPLPDAKEDATGRFSIASIPIKSVIEASDPALNIEVKPQDVISVPKGEIVYLLGAVRKPGGFVIAEQNGLSLLQAISLAEGFDRFADTKHSKIMRPVPNTKRRTEIPVDLKALLAGKAEDMRLLPDDVLLVPTSGKKAATVQVLQSALGVGTTIGSYAGYAIYR